MGRVDKFVIFWTVLVGNFVRIPYAKITFKNQFIGDRGAFLTTV